MLDAKLTGVNRREAEDEMVEAISAAPRNLFLVCWNGILEAWEL